MFDDVLGRYTTYHELSSVKTSNMGSLFRLTYDVGMASGADEKAMIDELRARNGNLEISLSHQEVSSYEPARSPFRASWKQPLQECLPPFGEFGAVEPAEVLPHQSA